VHPGHVFPPCGLLWLAPFLAIAAIANQTWQDVVTPLYSGAAELDALLRDIPLRGCSPVTDRPSAMGPVVVNPVLARAASSERRCGVSSGRYPAPLGCAGVSASIPSTAPPKPDHPNSISHHAKALAAHRTATVFGAHAANAGYVTAHAAALAASRPTGVRASTHRRVPRGAALRATQRGLARSRG